MSRVGTLTGIVWIKGATVLLVGALATASESWEPWQGAHRALCQLSARITGTFAEWVDLPVYVDGTRVHSVGYSIHIVPECTGAVAFAILLSGSLLLHASRRRRVSLALATVAGAALLNILRLLTILSIGQWH